jgi:hypothetical protein
VPLFRPARKGVERARGSYARADQRAQTLQSRHPLSECENIQDTVRWLH